MRKDLDDKLVKDFPNLYRERHGDPLHTCMCWGFPEDGWFNLIYELSSKLEALILQQPPENRELYAAKQCKQKFDRLELYMDNYTKEMFELIQEAREASLLICEDCGKNKQFVGEIAHKGIERERFRHVCNKESVEKCSLCNEEYSQDHRCSLFQRPKFHQTLFKAIKRIFKR
jgi:hypothetical protein